MSELTDQQLLRYSRQLLLDEVGFDGQEKLNKAHIVLIGVGGLGSLSAAYLVASGVGKITLVDDDQVEITNLHRQLLYRDSDLGEAKVTIAKQQLLSINPDCEIETIATKLSLPELTKLFASANIVLDGTDNFASRFLINQACFDVKTPLVSAAVTRFMGQLSTFDYGVDTPCYACLFSADQIDQQADNACAENGVLGAAVGVIASYQALHTMKYLLGLAVESLHHLVVIDMLSGIHRCLKLEPDNGCNVCSSRANK